MQHLRHLKEAPPAQEVNHIPSPSLALKLLTALIPALVWMPAAAAAMEFPETRLNERVLLLQHGPWAETMTVLDAGTALIVIDTWGSLDAARQAKARAESLFHKPVQFVVNTHHHWDHTFGNGAFPKAKTIAHRFCVEDMRSDYADAGKRKAYFEDSAASAGQESLRRYILEVGRESSSETFRLSPPNQTVKDRGKLRIGNLTVLLYHTPGIHTRSNLTVFVPELGILFGRIEFANPDQFALEPGADPRKIARVLEEVLAYGKPVRYLIPGHGGPVVDPDLKRAIERLKGM